MAVTYGAIWRGADWPPCGLKGRTEAPAPDFGLSGTKSPLTWDSRENCALLGAGRGSNLAAGQGCCALAARESDHAVSLAALFGVCAIVASFAAAPRPAFVSAVLMVCPQRGWVEPRLALSIYLVPAPRIRSGTAVAVSYDHARRDSSALAQDSAHRMAPPSHF